MLFILKSLLLAPSAKKLSEYQTQFLTVFKGREPLFDELFSVIASFYNTYQEFLTPTDLLESLNAEGHVKLAEYLSNLLTDPTIPIHTEEAQFFAALEREELEFTKQQAVLTFRRAEAALAQPKGKGLAGIIPSMDTLLLEIHQLKARVQRSETSTSSLLMGSEDVGSGHSLPEIYNRIEKRRDSPDAVYFDLGVTKFADIRLKDGDLVVFGGFTSHGKSILLRHMAYRQLYRYGRNVAFYSAEMSHDACRGLFALMHANNKIEYPNTPFITYDAYKSGTLTPAEKDFLFHVADHGLRNDPKLGTLYIDQPNKSKFRLSDLQDGLLALEATMPVHCCVVDYLTLMHPLESGRGHPERADFNDLIKGFKNLLITHRDIQGNVAPMLGITAHQISRHGFDACLKADKRYEIAAFTDYSEIEKSADNLFTVLMTPDMKNANQMRLQHLKNRDGAVVEDPVEVYIDFVHGMKVSNTADRPHTELTAIFKILNR
ncbi:MAG: DnaB-like helicase C-terminal domain-containing protein [Pseudomonadota bacterium]|nr:DnaB-like helicase C-terminal domain-containing protein [Pseudomonadota bacterium]